MKNTLTKFAVLPLAIAILSGCATKTMVTADANRSNAQIDTNRNALIAATRQADAARVAAQDVQRPYLVGNSTPLARDVNLPDILRRPTPITALFSSGPVDLQVALTQLSETAKIPVTGTPDAFLPASSFYPKSGTASSPVQAPPRVVVRAQNIPLWQVFDDIARQASINWRPVNGGAEFYRLETRIFYISGISQSATTSASLGRNGGSNTAFDSQSKTSFESKDQNLMKGVISTVDALLSTGGKATLAQENQTLIVVDTKESLDRVDAFIKEQNKAMSRRVRVLIEAIEVVDKDSSEFGVDWTTLYATTAGAIASASPASLVSAVSGTITAKGRDGTSALVLKALDEVGVVVNRRSFPFVTTSGRPVTQAIRSTFNYVDQVQAPNVGSSVLAAQPAPTITQKDETVGTFVTLVPTAKADGTVFLSISFDVTSAQPLVPFSAGGITVQQKTIDGTGVIQEVPMRSGQTVVIGGIETTTSLNTQRRMAPFAPILFGGSDATKLTRSRMVLLVTAVIEEGV